MTATGNRTIITPDVAVIRWIENDGRFLEECNSQLQPHAGDLGPVPNAVVDGVVEGALITDPALGPLLRVLEVYAFKGTAVEGIGLALEKSSNDYPPDHFAGPGYRDWDNWRASKEYRSYIHIPSMTVVCNGNNEIVSANPRDLDYVDENNPTSRPNVIKDPNRSPYGYTKIPVLSPQTIGVLGPRPEIPKPLYYDYDLADVYLDHHYNGLRWEYSGDYRIGRPRECIHLHDQRASRLSSTERHLQWRLTGYDAPFIYTAVDVFFCCQSGDTEVYVNASCFPSTQLYINGRKVKNGYIKQDRLYEFFVAGGRKANESDLTPPGHGVLAPAAAQGIYWRGR